MQRRPHLFLFVGTLLAGCGAPSAPEAEVLPSSEQVAVAPAAGGFAPSANWKVERKRRAMLGLRYDSGRVLVVPSEAEAVLAAIGDRTDSGLLARILRDGRTALDENRALDAIAHFTKAVLLEPESADHFVPLGRSLQAFNLESQAIAAWETGFELNPEHAELAFHVADMAYRQGATERARALFERTAQLDRNHAGAWGRLARLDYFERLDDDAWRAIHRVEDLGETVPRVMRTRLAARSPEPLR